MNNPIFEGRWPKHAVGDGAAPEKEQRGRRQAAARRGCSGSLPFGVPAVHWACERTWSPDPNETAKEGHCVLSTKMVLAKGPHGAQHEQT